MTNAQCLRFPERSNTLSSSWEILFELYFGSKKKFWQRLDRIGSLYSTVYFIGHLIYHAASQGATMHALRALRFGHST